MKKQFTLTRDAVVGADAAELRAAIVDATGSEYGAESIVRSLERLGADPSIERYEISCIAGSRSRPGAESVSWRVRADRGLEVEPEHAIDS